MVNIGVDALIDSIGNIFVAFNNTADFSYEVIASINLGVGTSIDILGWLFTIAFFLFSVGIVWHVITKYATN